MKHFDVSSPFITIWSVLGELTCRNVKALELRGDRFQNGGSLSDRLGKSLSKILFILKLWLPLNKEISNPTSWVAFRDLCIFSSQLKYCRKSQILAIFLIHNLPLASQNKYVNHLHNFIFRTIYHIILLISPVFLSHNVMIIMFSILCCVSFLLHLIVSYLCFSFCHHLSHYVTLPRSRYTQSSDHHYRDVRYIFSSVWLCVGNACTSVYLHVPFWFYFSVYSGRKLGS